MAFYSRFVNRTEFASYEDMKNGLEIRVPEKFNFAYDVLDVIAKEEPDRTALLWCDDFGGEKHFTFRNIAEISAQTANFLKAQGISKGDTVMLVLKRHWQFWTTIMALHRIGAVAIPATHLLTAKDLDYRFNRADVKAIVCTTDHNFTEEVNKAQLTSPTLTTKIYAGGHGTVCGDGWLSLDEEITQYSSDFARPSGSDEITNDDTMLLYFTSGTSGYPKMVIHDFAYPLGHIITAGFWHSAKDGGLHMTVAETGWAKAVWGKLYGQWLSGSAVFVYDMEKFVPTELLKKIQDYKITTFCSPPTMYRFMIKEDMKSYDLSSLKELTVAGEALNPEVFNRVKEYTGIEMRESFGQTEVVALVCTFPGMKIKPGSMGKPSPCYDVDIVNLEGKNCMPGEVGEIVINTSNGKPVGMFKGYYKDPELTAEVWHDGWYHSGDLAYRDEEGYFWYVGRKDDVIKSSGYRIGPFEVESALMTHPAVLECAITGVPDELRGQVVKATVVLTKGYEPSEELKKELQNHVKKNTAPYKYPRIVEFVSELPKTISGKIRRVEIREKDKNKE